MKKKLNNRSDYKRVHGQIENCVMKLFASNKCLPTNQEIAEELGLNRRTVSRHIKSINLNTYLPRLSTLTPKLLQRYYAKIMTNPQAKDIELWMRVVEGKM